MPETAGIVADPSDRSSPSWQASPVSRREAVSTPLTMTFELKFRQLVDCWFGDPLLGNDLAPQTERLTS